MVRDMEYPHQSKGVSRPIVSWPIPHPLQATLLLPSEPSSGHEVITPEFVQDHVVFCNLASTDNTAVVTLSGLRGHLVKFVVVPSRTDHFADLSPPVRLSHSDLLYTGPPGHSRLF